MATALTLAIGTEKHAYTDNLKSHYADVQRRLRVTQPPKNKIRQVLADKAERERIKKEKRAQRRAEFEFERRIHINPFTALPIRYEWGGEGELHKKQREADARESRSREARLKGLWHIQGEYDFTDAIDIILEHFGVTWAVATDASRRQAHAVAARATIACLFYQFLGTKLAARHALRIERAHQMDRYCEIFPTIMGISLVFSRAVSCVKHK